MWFGFKNESTWVPVAADRVKEILELNKKGITPDTLFENDTMPAVETRSALNKDLENMDRKYSNKDKNRNRNKKKNRFKKRNKKRDQ